MAKPASALVALCGVVAACTTGLAQTIIFKTTADSSALPDPQVIGIDFLTGPAPFKFGGVSELFANAGGSPTDFIVVSPSSGTAPVLVVAVLNPNVVPYLVPGNYGLKVSFVDPASSAVTWQADIVLGLLYPPRPSIASVVNAATLQPSISPGEIVSILGTNLSTPPLSGQFNDAGLLPTALGNTTVTFNGVAAPLLYVSNAQINAVVPFSVAGKTRVDVVVQRTYNPSQVSPAFSVPVVDASPGIFTANQSGSGLGAVLNADCADPYILTVNSIDNPATNGCAISLYATGVGVWNRTFPDGGLFIASNDPGIAPAAPVFLTIGGHPAKLLYAGPARRSAWGVLQINALVPDGIGSGPQPVVLSIGQNDNSKQQVTVAVK